MALIFDRSLFIVPVWCPTTQALVLARLLPIPSWIVPRVVSPPPHHTGSWLGLSFSNTFLDCPPCGVPFSPPHGFLSFLAERLLYVPHRIIFKTFLKIPTPVSALKNFPCELQHLRHCEKLVINKAMYALSTYAFCLRNLSKFNEIGSFATNLT